MSFSKKIFSVVFFVSLTSALLSQDTLKVRDFETWVGMGLKKDMLNKKLEIGFNEEFRFYNNSSELNSFFSEVNVEYEIFKDFKFGVAYRFIKEKNQSHGFSTDHRINTDLAYKYDINRFTLGVRLRYQIRNETMLKSETDVPQKKYRIKLEADYNIKKWKLDPYFSSEIFFFKETDPFNYLGETYSSNLISGPQKLRFTLGTDYKIKKAGKIKLFYAMEYEFQNYSNLYKIPEQFFILGVNYNFSF